MSRMGRWRWMGAGMLLLAFASAAEEPPLDPVMRAAVDGVRQDLRHSHDQLGKDFVWRVLRDRRTPWPVLFGEERGWRRFVQDARQLTDDGTPAGPMLGALAEQRRLFERERYLSCPPAIRAVNRIVRHLPVRMNGADVPLCFGELIGTIPAAAGMPERRIAIASLQPEFSCRAVYGGRVYFFGVLAGLSDSGETVSAGGDETVLCAWCDGKNIFNLLLGPGARILDYRPQATRLDILCSIREADGERRVLRRIPYAQMGRLPLIDAPFAAAALCRAGEAAK